MFVEVCENRVFVELFMVLKFLFEVVFYIMFCLIFVDFIVRCLFSFVFCLIMIFFSLF